jgi:hypothetical protein
MSGALPGNCFFPLWSRFAPQGPVAPEFTKTQVIFWWELRRPAYNMALFIVGLLSVVGMEFVMNAVIPLGEDAVEPLGLLAGIFVYGCLANVCYTLGWVFELAWRKQADAATARRMAIGAFRAGFLFSVVLTTAPLWWSFLFWITAKARG